MTPSFGVWAAGCGWDLHLGEEEWQLGRLMMGSTPDVLQVRVLCAIQKKSIKKWNNLLQKHQLKSGGVSLCNIFKHQQ